MKSFILYCFLAIGLLQGASTTTKIETSKKNLSLTLSAKKQANRKLGKIASDIQSAEKDIVYLEKKIGELGKEEDKTQKRYELLKVELNRSQKEFTKTSQELEQKHKAFITLLSEQFSVIFAMEQSHEPTRTSIISQEVYEAYKMHNTKVLASLRSEISTLQKRKKDKLYLRDKAQKEIKQIVKKREDFAAKKLAKKKLLKKLSGDEEKYNAQLAKIGDEQNALRATLAKLNILHAQEVEEARRIAAQRKEAMRLEKERKIRMRKERELAQAKARKANRAIELAKTQEAKNSAKLAAKEAEKEVEQVQQKSIKQSEQVRRINSSYQQSKVYAYRGGKTISPIRGGQLIKKFGTYIDPIYKIKIFNESITLRAPVPNAKVQNILNGKVVFAGKSSMLGNVVVVAHNDKIHTVYAGLSKIAPNIQAGRKIKKGYVIGKVTSKLMFQATKESKHINPMELIQI